jgi:hypothetical protein
MSTSRRDGCLSLAEYVAALVAALADEDPAGAERLRAIVGHRRARISLDAEKVVVGFPNGELEVTEDGADPVDGWGATDGQTVLELLDGYLEVSDAIAQDRLRVQGKLDGVVRMHHAIELLIDAGVRGPALQALADRFRADPCRPPRRPPDLAAPAAADSERPLLARYDLLP